MTEREELLAWADEAQALIDGGEVPSDQMRKANATVAALRGVAQAAVMPIKASGNDQLSKLWNSIVDNTQGDGFWIGEILLTTLEREVGFNPSPLTSTEGK